MLATGLCKPLPLHTHPLATSQAKHHLPATHPPTTAFPRFSWNKSQLEKARDEAQTQTNPLATALRGVLSAVPTALLVVASITKLGDTSYNKSVRWLYGLAA